MFHCCVNLSEIENILTKSHPRPWSGVSLLSWPGVIRCDIKYSNARQIPNCRNEHNINIRTLHTNTTTTHSSLSAGDTSIFVPTFYRLNHCKYWCFSVDWLTQGDKDGCPSAKLTSLSPNFRVLNNSNGESISLSVQIQAQSTTVFYRHDTRFNGNS